MGVQAITAIAILFHIAAIVAGIYADNLTGFGEAYYGGDSGPLPGAASGYHTITDFLAGSDRPEVDQLGSQGGLVIFRWIITGPMCVAASLVKLLLSITTFNYAVVQVLPDYGFGLWIKLLIHAVSTLITLITSGKLVIFLLQAGVLSNPYALVALGIIGSVGLISVAANGTGALSC